MSFHHYSRRLLILTAALAFVAACSSSDEPPSRSSDVTDTMDTLVSAEWLAEHLDDENLVVLDCTVIVEMGGEDGFKIVNGRANYEKGHIPGAGFADLMGELSDEDSPHQFAVPTPEQFAAAMGSLGVGDDSRVVLYSATNVDWAARVWWMLRWIGFDRAALLDGGVLAWKLEGQSLSTEPAVRPAKTLSFNVRPELIADRDEVFASIGDEGVNIIDTLPEAQYQGGMNMYGRPGHIPGASNVPSQSLVDETGRYRPRDELIALIGEDRDNRAITYCGGGIAASNNAFIMTRLGFKDVAVYTASLQEWATDPANPLETE